jgi:hypothetical protein
MTAPNIPIRQANFRANGAGSACVGISMTISILLLCATMVRLLVFPPVTNAGSRLRRFAIGNLAIAIALSPIWLFRVW